MVAYEGQEKYIFVSYAHKDSKIVLPIIEKLQANGFRVWFDQGIEAGTEWYIEEHIVSCETVLVFMSPAAVSSINCRNEINYSLSIHKQLLIIYLEETELINGMNLQLNSAQSMYKYRNTSEQSFLDELFKAHILSECREKSDVISDGSQKLNIDATSNSINSHRKTKDGLRLKKNTVLAAVLSIFLILSITLSTFFFPVLFGNESTEDNSSTPSFLKTGDTTSLSTKTTSTSIRTTTKNTITTPAATIKDTTVITQATSTNKVTTTTTTNGFVLGDPLPGYEDIDFGGYIFTFAAPINATDGWADYEVYAEEEIGTISAAIIERNDVMYDIYGAFIEVEDINLDTLANDFATNQNKIDIVNFKYGLNTKGDGNYLNFHALDIDLDMPWWDSGFIKDATVDNQLYGIIGAFSLTSFDSTWALFFNKNVLESSKNISSINLYKLLETNEWTVDKMFEIAKLAYVDNGEKGMHLTSDSNDMDIFGFVSSDVGIRNLYFGMGQSYSVKNDDKYGVSSITHAFTDSASIATNKILAIYEHESCSLTNYYTANQQFENNLALFTQERLKYTSMFAESTAIGILPQPKISMEQTNYKHTIDGHMIYTCVPKTCTNIQRISDFLTLYAYHSYCIVYPAYLNYIYECTGNVEDIATIDIILNTRSFDLTYQFGWASVDSEYISSVKQGQNAVDQMRFYLASAIESAAAKYKEYLSSHNS